MVARETPSIFAMSVALIRLGVGNELHAIRHAARRATRCRRRQKTNLLAMTAARRSQRKRSSRTLVLMATMRSSANDSQDQTISRAHLRQEHSTSASDRPRFSRIHGVPTGAPQLFETAFNCVRAWSIWW